MKDRGLAMSLKELYKNIKKYNYIKRQNKNQNSISKKCDLDNTIFEGHNKVIGNSLLSECYLGKGSYVGTGCVLRKTKIGRFCSLGSNIWIADGNHPTFNYVSTHPAFFRKEEFCSYNFGASGSFVEHKFTGDDCKWICEIGNDVWIGDSVLILGGVKIGNGAIIGAGAVLTKNVPPYSIVTGVPAKVLRYRFKDYQIQWLERFKWWNKDEDWLLKNIALFENIDVMMAKYNLENEA